MEDTTILHVAQFFAPNQSPIRDLLLDEKTFAEDHGKVSLPPNVEILYQWVDSKMMIFATKQNEIGFPQLYFVYSFDPDGKRTQLAHYNVKAYSPQNRSQTSMLYKQFFNWHPTPLHL